MELISFIITCMVLWFEFVTRTVLTTYQYFCCCWTALVQPQGVFFCFFYSAPQVRRLTTPTASEVNKLPLCLHTQLFLHLLNSLSLSPWGLFPSTFSHPEGDESEQAVVWVPNCWQESTYHKCRCKRADNQRLNMHSKWCFFTSMIVFISICLFYGW